MSSSDATGTIPCPVCRTSNSESHYFCYFCGALLQPGRHDATAPIPDADKQLKPQLRMGDFHFDGNKRLELMISHSGVAIPVHLRDGDSIILGRRSKPTQIVKTADETQLELTPEQRATLLAAAQSSEAPKPAEPKDPVNTIDLTRFKGVELGVSRKHALLIRNENRLQVRDMKSSNGTYLNDAPISAQHTRLVRENDVLRLGNLQIVVLFQQIPKES